MKLTSGQQRFAAYSVVGYGSEVQNLPVYRARWAGNAASGWSFGVTQTDLGRRDRERGDLQKAYDKWAADEAAMGRTHPEITDKHLKTRNGEGLEPVQLNALNTFLGTDTGRNLIDSWDAHNVAELIDHRGGALDRTTYFTAMDAKDQFVVMTGAMKVENQSGPNSKRNRQIEDLLSGKVVTENGQTFQVLATEVPRRFEWNLTWPAKSAVPARSHRVAGSRLAACGHPKGLALTRPHGAHAGRRLDGRGIGHPA